MTDRRQARCSAERRSQPRVRAAFSLVELVIVVVIISIIAAIAVPRFTRATVAATESYVNSAVGTVRRAIEMYYAEHDTYPGYNPANGNPDGDWFVRQLLEYSDEDGNTRVALGAPYIYGPYLREPFPRNPFNDLATVQVLADPSCSVTPGATGWVAVLSNGDFGINATQEDMEDFAYSAMPLVGGGNNPQDM